MMDADDFCGLDTAEDIEQHYKWYANLRGIYGIRGGARFSDMPMASLLPPHGKERFGELESIYKTGRRNGPAGVFSGDISQSP